ncbi:MAG TPA: DUF4838 domain-containing protein [Candidatus Paceibacterota bacterium]|nr:DUF4838 domain-containing protein [Verrucomicrobiota bacterium]HSA10969.1 DUF4838 domain-containing protein [Candidatus Paceibacterota bacterium]
MKLRLTFQTLVVANLACASAQAEWVNTLKPPGKPAGRITVAKSGRPQGVIQLPDRPTPQETNAAAQLQFWIKEITGATLAINPGKARGSLIAIRTDASLGDEGYGIGVNRGQIILSGGKTRGVMNAVYALLEEDLGCRFYADDSVRLPRAGTLVIAPVARRYVPRLKIRDPFYACAFDPVWSLRNRANAPSAAVPEELGGRVDYDGMFVHTHGQILPPDKYLKEHPDYFAQQADGNRTPAQLCATHPEVVRIAIDYVRKVLKENPDTEILSVSKNDCQVSCLCERCKELRAAEGSDMANQLFLVNQVAAAIEQEHPDVIIDTLAYLETIQVPKTVRPRKNVAIRLCNDSVGAWSRPFTPAEKCDVAKLASAWGAVHNRIYIWDYNVNFSHYLAPMPNLDVMAANIRFWIQHNAEGVMLQGGYQGPAERDQMKCWVTAKLLWNPSWDEQALARDFVQGHYGKAASAILDYEALLEKTKTDHARDLASPAGGIRYPMDAPFFDKDFVTQATDIFARAKTLAGGEAELLRRVERAELPILYVKCVRGPGFVGDSYAQVVAEFERIARREKVRFLQEGGTDFEAKLAGYKNQIRKPATGL